MNKKKDLPAMPFYIGDWNKDPAIKTLSREEKMIWLEMIFLMWESKERGYLTINDKPYSMEMLASSLNLDNQKLSKTLAKFETLDLYSKREPDGAIYSRFIVKLVNLSETRKRAGKQGGSPYLLNQKKSSSLTNSLTKSEARGLPNTEDESEYENEDENENEINIKEVKEYFEFQGSSELAQDFYDHFNAQDWLTGTGRPITNWRSKANVWIKKELAGETNASTGRVVKDDNEWKEDIKAAEKEIKETGTIQPGELTKGL